MSDSAPWEDYQQQPDQGPWTEYVQPQQPTGGVMGALKGASRALEANLPFVDRAVAAAKGGDYAANLATERAKNADFAQQNPVSNFVGGVAASAPLVPLGGIGGSLGARTAASAMGSGLYGELQGISSSPDLTSSAETGPRAAEGFGVGGLLGAAAPPVAAGIGKVISPLAAGLSKGPGAADVAKLGGDVTAAYQNVKDLGASYSPAAFKGLTDKIAADAAEADIDPGLNPKASAIIKNLQSRAAAKAESGEALTLPELDKMRQFVNDNLGGLPEPKQARFGALIKGNIDDFIKNTEPQTATPVPAATPTFNPDATLPTQPQALPSNLKRNLDRQADYHEQVRDLYDLAVEHGIVRSRLQFDNPSEMQANQIQDLYNQFKVQPWEPNFRDPNNLNLPDQWPINPPANYPTGGENASLGRTPQFGRLESGQEPPSLVVARKMPDGTIKYGQSGQIHSDLTDIDRMGEPDFVPFEPKDMGFAKPGGPFMSRQEAADFVAKNEPSRTPEDYERGESFLQAEPYTEPERLAQFDEQRGAAPSAAEAHGAIQTARDLAMRQFKAKALADALNKAGIAADTAGTGGNIENATRQRLARLLDKEPWSPDEIGQLNDMIHGNRVTNTLRQFSRFGPKGNALMAAMELGSGSPRAIGAAVGGTAAQAGEALARRAGQGKLLATILAGGKAPVAASGSGPTRAALAAALAARQQLPQQQNMQK